ncbi:hypothetical protein SCALM49S_06129 [Streptomyces californicus]
MHRWLLRTLPLAPHAYADEVVDCAIGGLAPRMITYGVVLSGMWRHRT